MPNWGDATTVLGSRHPAPTSKEPCVILDAPTTMSQARKVRTVILTAGVTATAITGAWYGAGLKVKQDIKKVWINFSDSDSFMLSIITRIPLLTVLLRA